MQDRWIREHKSSAQEVADLLAISGRDIAQSQTQDLGPEWRDNIAYNAVLQLATLALVVTGYQTERQNKHQRTKRWSLPIGLDKDLVNLIDVCRRKRHTNVCDQVGAISDTEATEIIQIAKSLREQIATWLADQHPDLLDP
ncbi:MAG: hypothetical protein CMJ78_08660 [Planctomycetaceae bacterium]|nr:hypothetical protein [Planctomycetaceae bacterium]